MLFRSLPAFCAGIILSTSAFTSLKPVITVFVLASTSLITLSTEPVVVQINKARVTGLLFGNNPLLFLSLSPHGMEDIPSYVKTEITQYAKNRNYSRTLLVDCHNAMGEEIEKADGEDMLKAAKSCLDSLITKDSFPIEFGHANSDRKSTRLNSSH